MIVHFGISAALLKTSPATSTKFLQEALDQGHLLLPSPNEVRIQVGCFDAAEQHLHWGDFIAIWSGDHRFDAHVSKEVPGLGAAVIGCSIELEDRLLSEVRVFELQGLHQLLHEEADYLARRVDCGEGHVQRAPVIYGC